MESTSEPVNLNVGNGKYFGPDDELPFNVQQECLSLAKKNVESNGGFDLIKNLEKDDTDLREPGQEISLVSFIGPYDSLKAKHTNLMFNIRGVCDTIDSTRKKLADIEEITKKYDIYTFEMYTWIAIPPNPDFMRDNDLHEKHLNKIISEHKFKLELDSQLFEARKRMMSSNPDLNKEQIEEIKGEEIKGEDQIEEIEQIKGEEIEQIIEEKIEEKIEEQVIKNLEKIDIKDFSEQNNIAETSFMSKEKLDQCSEEGLDYTVISIVGDDNLGRALKIKGFYETEQEARDKTKELSEIDSTFENYVIETYRWLKADIKPDDIEDQVYDNEELNLMTKEQKAQKKKANKHIKQNPVIEDDVSSNEISSTEISSSEVSAASVLSDLENDSNLIYKA